MAAHDDPPHTVATHQFVGNDPGITHYPVGPLPMPLSDFACKNAKPKLKPYRLADGDGLYLLVQKSGSKLWQLRYRYLEKENILSFGKYPLVSLLDAREKRDDAKRLLVAGINPSTKRKE
ncbi:Arm DNA-binding domain-containing protein, partial [Aurantimonas sp. A3-2-R12]|uniref:Arm DNA-binding domain-containing protein n=1 Tax=Aurantimonas sp. A3-2-R12 TaxID=3114362 RepID=UPI002E179A8A